MRSTGYQGDEYLKWQDIELRATGSGDELMFKMTVKLLYRKGHKRDKSGALIVELGELADDNASAIDPAKLCIAYALRVGAVKERSWPELLDAVRTRPGKRVLWAKPTSPVFCAITRSNQLDMSRPAIVQQNLRFLTRAAGLISMLNVPITHDIRRGAGSDVYSLKSDTNSGDWNRVRRTLAHSHAATARGTTDEYIGHDKVDSWAERVAQAPKDTGVEVPDGLGTAPFRKRRVQSKDIDEYCDDHEMDKTITKDRNRAGLALGKLQREQWANYQRDVLDGVQALTANLLPPQASGLVTNARARAPLQDLTNFSRTTSDSGALTRKLLSKDLEEDGDRLAQDNINPALCTFANDVLGVQIGPATSNMGSTAQGVFSLESMVEGCISLLSASPSPVGNEQELALLTAPRDQFIGYLSTINLVRVSTQRTLEGDATGNSRDPPSMFFFHCRNMDCPRRFLKALERDEHQVNCRPASARPAPLGLDGVQRDAVVPPPAPTTTKRAYNKRKAEDSFEPGFPTVCPESDTCGIINPINTANALKQHRANYHDSKWPRTMPCNYPGCQLPRNHYSVSRNLFRRHLNRSHMLKDAQAQHYISKILPPS